MLHMQHTQLLAVIRYISNEKKTKHFINNYEFI